VSAQVPPDLDIQSISEETLPGNWKAIDAPVMALRDIGTAWLKSCSSPVARVPSGVTFGEYNYLLNPLHPDFPRIRPRVARPFAFDQRMWK
jgi:RES domain-containing protein